MGGHRRCDTHRGPERPKRCLSDTVDQGRVQIRECLRRADLGRELGSTKVASTARVAARPRPWSGIFRVDQDRLYSTGGCEAPTLVGNFEGRPRSPLQHGWLRGADLGRGLWSTKITSTTRVAARPRPWSTPGNEPTIEAGGDQGQE